MAEAPTDSLDDGPRYAVVRLASPVDDAARTAAEEAAAFLRALVRDVDEREAAALTQPPPDGVVVVVAADSVAATLMGEVAAQADALKDRAVALVFAGVAAEDAKVVGHGLRKTLRKGGALVLERQVVVPQTAFGVYGLEDETFRERLEGLMELLDHEADRLLPKRTGWEEPDDAAGAHWEPTWLGTRERDVGRDVGRD